MNYCNQINARGECERSSFEDHVDFFCLHVLHPEIITKYRQCYIVYADGFVCVLTHWLRSHGIKHSSSDHTLMTSTWSDHRQAPWSRARDHDPESARDQITNALSCHDYIVIWTLTWSDNVFTFCLWQWLPHTTIQHLRYREYHTVAFGIVLTALDQLQLMEYSVGRYNMTLLWGCLSRQRVSHSGQRHKLPKQNFSKRHWYNTHNEQLNTIKGSILFWQIGTWSYVDIFELKRQIVSIKCRNFDVKCRNFYKLLI